MPEAIKTLRIGHTKLKTEVQSMGYKVKMTSEESKKIVQGCKDQGEKYGLPRNNKKSKAIKK